jgi:hypothetical protein
MRSKAIYYRGDKEGINGKGRDKGIRNKGRNNKRNSKSKAQSFIYTSDALFTNNFIDRKSL